MPTCSTITRNGRCPNTDVNAQGICTHHQQMNRLLSLAKPSKASSPPTSSRPQSQPLSSQRNPVPKAAHSAVHIPATSYKHESTPSVTSPTGYLPGEKLLTKISCSFEVPQIVDSYRASSNGVLKLTNYRIQFAPSSSVNASTPAIIKTAMKGLPCACVGRIGYPQGTSTSDGRPTCVEIMFKTMQKWILRGDVNALIMTLNSNIFQHSPLSLFAFASGNQSKHGLEKELAGHHIYNIEADFARMGVVMGSGPFRICTINSDYTVCPTYPRKFAVPATITDYQIRSVAQFRSKGRLPVLCWVHGNSASLWRCAQPKRGILGAHSEDDTNMLARIIDTNPTSTKVWIVDCRPELNARANNFTGGGTESSSIQHASVSFFNIANIHAMRESIQGIRTLATLNSNESDLNWFTRVEQTKWLYHVRLVLSGALRVASAINNEARTVVVHCSDGWDRTGQICALSQLLLDPRYRTLSGFMQLIEKEWMLIGHKFYDRVGPGMAETDEQSPVFLQFLDCCWQLLRQFTTYFEFNAKMLEFVAYHLYSAEFGTFLFNSDRERATANVANRTRSLWTHINSNRNTFTNRFYRASDEVAMLPFESPSVVLRQVILWNEVYLEHASIQSVAKGTSIPPLWASSDWQPQLKTSHDLEDTVIALNNRIQQLEREATRPDLSNLSLKTIPANVRAELIRELRQDLQQTPVPAPPTSLRTSASSIQPVDEMQLKKVDSSSWQCRLCTKVNDRTCLKCVVCGRGKPIVS